MNTQELNKDMPVGDSVECSTNYPTQKHELVSRIAFLTGVPKAIFEKGQFWSYMKNCRSVSLP